MPEFSSSACTDVGFEVPSLIMAKHFADEDAKIAFKGAIVSIEDRSSAEVIIVVRHHSGSYLHADLMLGGAVAIGTLAFALFSAFSFSLISIFIDPLAVGATVGFLSTKLAWGRRALTRESARRAQVEVAARCAFYEKGVRMTQGRTGMLIYISLLERMVSVVIDRGVEDAVPQERWQAAIKEIEETLRRTMNGVETATKLLALGAICEPVLERSDDDINELPDEVSAS